MKKTLLALGTIVGVAAPSMAVVACGEDPAKDEATIMLEEKITLNGVPEIMKEVVTYKIEPPRGTSNIYAGMAHVWYQLRCGLVGHAKVELMQGEATNGSTIYWGNKWRLDLGGIMNNDVYNFNSPAKYNELLKKYYSWAMSVEDAKVHSGAFKLTPVEVTFDYFGNDISNVENKYN